MRTSDARLRQAWPQVRLIVRGDSGFCRQRLIRWCERSGVGYVIGVARNTRRVHILLASHHRLRARFFPASNALLLSFSHTRLAVSGRLVKYPG